MLVPAPPHLNIYPFPFNSFFTNFELMCKLPFFAKFAFMRDQHVRIQWRYFITCVVENMDSMFSCIFFVRIAMTCIVPRGYLRGPPLKRSRFLGVVLSGGGSLPNSHLCEINMCACINYNGDISLHVWLKIANQNGQWYGRNVLLHFYLCA